MRRLPLHLAFPLFAQPGLRVRNSDLVGAWHFHFTLPGGSLP